MNLNELRIMYGFKVYFLAVFVSGLSACTGLPIGQESVVITRAQMQMGTLVKITAVAGTESAAQASVSAGFAEIRRLEELLSTWIPTSELSRVNASAGIKPVPVSLETWTVVQRAKQAAELTGGGFNVAIGPAVDLWRVTEDQRIPTAAELAALLPMVDLQAVRADLHGQTLYLEKPGMRIDVGDLPRMVSAHSTAVVSSCACGTTALIAPMS